jgi:hypothetical protein
MPRPTLRGVQPVNQLLTNLSIGWMLDPDNFPANLLAPVIPVRYQTGAYTVYDRGDFFRLSEIKARAPGTSFSRAGFGLTTQTYSCTPLGLEFPVPDEIMANAMDPIAPDQLGINGVGQKFRLHTSKLVVDEFFTTEVWGRDLAGQSGSVSTESTTNFCYWNTPGANIIGVLKAQCNYVNKQTGRRPNVFACSQAVYDVMEQDAEIVDRFKHTAGGAPSMDGIAKLVGLGTAKSPGKIVVIDTPYNTAKEGAAVSMDFILGDSALLAYVDPAPALNKPTALACFSWSEIDKVAETGAPAITNYRDESTKSEIYRGERACDYAVIAADCAVFLNDILT